MFKNQTSIIAIVFIFVSYLLVTGCSVSSKTSKLPVEISTTKTSISGSRLFLENECPVSAPYEGLGTTLVAGILTSLVERTLGVVSNAIEALGKEKVVTKSVSASNHFFEISKAGSHSLANKCIVFVEGVFGEGEPKFDEHWKETASTDLFSNRIGLISVPKRYLEIHIRLSEDGNAFHARPGVFHFRQSENILRKENSDIAVAMVFQKPGQSDTKSDDLAFAALSFVIENVEQSSFLGKPALNGISSGWVPIRPLDNHELATIKSADIGSRHGPFSVHMSLNESQDASKFMQVIAGVFTDNKDSISSDINRIVLELANINTEENKE